MLSVRQCLGRKGNEVWSTRPDATVFEALQLMAEQPSIIKRPVVESAQLLLIGFKEDEYRQLL